MKRRKRKYYYKDDCERLQVKRQSVIREYKDKKYRPCEQTALDVLELFLPSFADSIEEDAYCVCYDDEDAKRIKDDLLRDVRFFLVKYKKQLNEIAKNDPMVKIQIDANSINEFFERMGRNEHKTQAGSTDAPE